MNCPLVQSHPVTVMLGKTGDLISILPALKSMHDATGEKPKVVVSEQYASVLEGVLYVEPLVTRFQWPRGTGPAREFAEREYGKTIVPQFWQDQTQRNDIPTGKLSLLMADGVRWSIDPE